MLDKLTREKKLEVAFVSGFSLVVVVLCYLLISMNGLVLGLDPAVHLLKAQIFLETGQIPLDNSGWVPPLFEILIAICSLFGGTLNAVQILVVEKVLAVMANWLLFLSVYLVGSKFFNKKVGALSAIFISLCYLIYFLNTWGGYTTALGMSFLLLLFYVSYLAVKQVSYVVVMFFVAFSVFLAHQLSAFLAAVIMLPAMLLLMIKFRGAYLKAFLLTALGGMLAFFMFYYPAIASHLDVVIYHIFFGNKAYAVDIPYTSFEAFLLYFGAIQFLALAGIAISYSQHKKQNKRIGFVILLLSFCVPLFFAKSYLLGFYLPFEWFTYYLAPPIAIFGAVCMVFIGQKIFAMLKKADKKHKVVAVGLIVVVVCPIFGLQVYNTYSQVMVAGAFNNRADMRTYEAATWVKQNYPSEIIVVTLNPGEWFAVFSDNPVIAQTYHWYGANPVADAVLNLHYEIQGPQTMLRTYEQNGNVTSENYVYINQLWNRVAYLSLSKDTLSFTQNAVNHTVALCELTKTVTLNNSFEEKSVEFTYYNNQVVLTQTILFQKDAYPLNVSWSITPLNGEITNAQLVLSTDFDLEFYFDKAQIPQFMEWTNPWDMPTKTTPNKGWVSVNFSSSELSDHYIGFYDQTKQTAFALNFIDVPDLGSIDALANRQINAISYQYNFKEIGVNQTVQCQYQVLAVTKDSYPALQPNELANLFTLKVDQFTPSVHNYQEYIAENNISLIVYDKTQFNLQTSSALSEIFLPDLAQCEFLELVYSNSKYDIFKILDSYNQTHIWK
ncbi:MAG: hypothetical protein LBH79_06650 [Nitrososphaerota archaeon]|nr:hypothetical protein [Nitrososphaerota archaeon]